MFHCLRKTENVTIISRCCCQDFRFVLFQQLSTRTTVQNQMMKLSQSTTNQRYWLQNMHMVNRHGLLLSYSNYRESILRITRRTFSDNPDSKKESNLTSGNNVKSTIDNPNNSVPVKQQQQQKQSQQQQQQQQQEQQPQQQQQQEQQGILRKFKGIINVFWTGCKALMKDVRIALRTRRKLGLYHAHDYDRLSREELRHLRQTRQDVVKTFPFALLFMVPFIGYTAPLIASFYPKQLLSQQFWHPDQKKEFVLEEYEQRSQYYLPLIKEAAVTAKEIHNKELFLFCLRILHGTHPENQELLSFKDSFTTHGDLNLTGMPRYHLIKLCKCWLIPTGWYLPRWYLMSALRKRIARLREDDTFILRDGIDLMTPECVEQAVHVRGLDETSLCDVSQVHWLTEWVDLSNQVKDKDVSFLAHAAVFKAANFERLRNEMASSNP